MFINYIKISYFYWLLKENGMSCLLKRSGPYKALIKALIKGLIKGNVVIRSELIIIIFDSILGLSF